MINTELREVLDGATDKFDSKYDSYYLESDNNNVMNVLKEDADKKNISFTANMRIQHRYVFADMVKIREINMNLFSNAIKYTEKGYVILDAKCVEDGGFADLSISITDSGIGIKKEDLGKLFNGFQQLDSRKKKNHEGTGLGLAIVKHIADIQCDERRDGSY